ncbi:amidase family protein [Ottowia thiooxydans]|uniref:amidase family protein n=1 Tax=Ottowia thiooxydans TaxID=219182 RepID=UPI00048BFA26
MPVAWGAQQGSHAQVGRWGCEWHVLAGLGTQAQGSILRPASFCGVVGYKPTWGAVPLSGVHPVLLRAGAVQMSAA